VLYAAKCYWPGVTPTELAEVASRAQLAGAAGDPEVAYLGSLFFADDDVVLCLFEGHSRASVRRATEQAGIPWERLMASAWVNPTESSRPTPNRCRYPASSPRQLGDKQ
jgi:hypothetical protein